MCIENEEIRFETGKAIRLAYLKYPREVKAWVMYSLRGLSRIQVGERLGTTHLGTVTGWVQSGRTAVQSEMPPIEDFA